MAAHYYGWRNGHLVIEAVNLDAPNPPTRIGNWILWPDGHHRKMTLWERLKWHNGRRIFDP